MNATFPGLSEHNLAKLLFYKIISVLIVLCFRTTDKRAIDFIRGESNKEDLRETSELNPTRWGRLYISAQAAVGVKDGDMAQWDFCRGKSLAGTIRRGRWKFILMSIGSHGQI